MISADTLQALFDPLPEVVFFVKDTEGRYTHANRTLLARLGLRERSRLIGATAVDVFPAPLGEHYLQQDLAVLRTGHAIGDVLERHLFPNHRHGWCLTQKLPLTERGKVTGLIGISRDLKSPARRNPVYTRLHETLDYARTHLEQTLRIATLADRAGLSIAQFERHFADLFQLTPQQWLTAQRLDKAMPLIAAGVGIASVAASCGFADHSAFSRAFGRHIGVPPRDYRRMLAASGSG